MRRAVYATLVLLLIFLCSCAGTTSRAAGVSINPGDRIGDFSFSKEGNAIVTHVSTMKCPLEPGTGAKSCVLRVGTKANIGTTLFTGGAAGGKSLEELWPGLTHELLVEGRAVNLQAFGYVDVALGGVGTVRTPDIVVVAGKPGKMTVRSTGVFGGKPFEHTLVLAFTDTGF